MYGTGAFFGAINIFTNKTDSKNRINFVSASAGSEKTKKIFVRAADRGDDYQYTFNGSFFDTYGINKPLDKMGPYQGTTGGLLENNEKYFNFSGTFKGFSIDASYSQSDKEVEVVLPSVSDGTLIVWKAFRFNFGYEYEFSDKVKLNARVGYFLDHWDFDYDFVFNNFYGRQTNGSSGFRTELNLFLKPVKKLNVTVGLNYNNVPDILQAYTLPAFGLNLISNKLAKGKSLVTQSIFTQADLVISNKAKIVAGFRLDQMPAYTLEREIGDFNTGVSTIQRATYSYKKVEFIPRFAVIYSIDRRNYIKFLYGKAINQPSFFQNLDLLIPSPKPLEPENIQTFEVNYTGNLTMEFSMSFSLFRNILDKLIYRTFSVDIDTGTYVSYQANVGKMTTNGVELTARYYLAKQFQMEIGGSYQDTKDKRPGYEDIAPGYSPKFLGYIKAYYYFNENMTLALTGNYVGKMESYWDSTLQNPDKTFGRRIGDPVKGYFLLGGNLRVNSLFGTGLFVNLRGSNLLNREVRYPATSNNSNFASKGTIGRGISFLFTIGYKF
jgi:outer membrane receptor protein involved in Fe transport